MRAIDATGSNKVEVVLAHVMGQGCGYEDQDFRRFIFTSQPSLTYLMLNLFKPGSSQDIQMAFDAMCRLYRQTENTAIMEALPSLVLADCLLPWNGRRGQYARHWLVWMKRCKPIRQMLVNNKGDLLPQFSEQVETPDWQTAKSIRSWFDFLAVQWSKATENDLYPSDCAFIYLEKLGNIYNFGQWMEWTGASLDGVSGLLELMEEYPRPQNIEPMLASMRRFRLENLAGIHEKKEPERRKM